MPEQGYRAEKYSLRFVGITEDLVRQAKACLPDGEWMAKELDGTCNWVLALQLDGHSTYDQLCDFVAGSGLPKKSFGLWVSLVTERDNDGVHVPDYVLAVQHRLGGNIDFSFVCVSPGDADEVPKRRISRRRLG